MPADLWWFTVEDAKIGRNGEGYAVTVPQSVGGVAHMRHEAKQKDMPKALAFALSPAVPAIDAILREMRKQSYGR